MNTLTADNLYNKFVELYTAKTHTVPKIKINNDGSVINETLPNQPYVVDEDLEAVVKTICEALIIKLAEDGVTLKQMEIK